MTPVTATYAQKNFGSLMRRLPRNPVLISQHGETRAILVNIEDWQDVVDGRNASLIEQSGDFMSTGETDTLLNSLVNHV